MNYLITKLEANIETLETTIKGVAGLTAIAMMCIIIRDCGNTQRICHYSKQVAPKTTLCETIESCANNKFEISENEATIKTYSLTLNGYTGSITKIEKYSLPDFCKTLQPKPGGHRFSRIGRNR